MHLRYAYPCDLVLLATRAPRADHLDRHRVFGIVLQPDDQIDRFIEQTIRIGRRVVHLYPLARWAAPAHLSLLIQMNRAIFLL
jgi:hypothetical protein